MPDVPDRIGVRASIFFQTSNAQFKSVGWLDPIDTANDEVAAVSTKVPVEQARREAKQILFVEPVHLVCNSVVGADKLAARLIPVCAIVSVLEGRADLEKSQKDSVWRCKLEPTVEDSELSTIGIACLQVEDVVDVASIAGLDHKKHRVLTPITSREEGTDDE